jgi:hypothetical protein
LVQGQVILYTKVKRFGDSVTSWGLGASTNPNKICSLTLWVDHGSGIMGVKGMSNILTPWTNCVGSKNELSELRGALSFNIFGGSIHEFIFIARRILNGTKFMALRFQNLRWVDNMVFYVSGMLASFSNVIFCVPDMLGILAMW